MEGHECVSYIYQLVEFIVRAGLEPQRKSTWSLVTGYLLKKKQAKLSQNLCLHRIQIDQATGNLLRHYLFQKTDCAIRREVGVMFWTTKYEKTKIEVLFSLIYIFESRFQNKNRTTSAASRHFTINA